MKRARVMTAAIESVVADGSFNLGNMDDMMNELAAGFLPQRATGATMSFSMMDLGASHSADQPQAFAAQPAGSQGRALGGCLTFCEWRPSSWSPFLEQFQNRVDA